MRLLFFSRGRGRGHAIPDMAIEEELLNLIPGLKVRFVSYASGADTLRAEGRAVVDLDLPEDPPLLEVLIRATRLVGEMRPDVAVIHEEFMAAPACRIFRIPTVFLTEWFTDPTAITMHCVHYADRVLALSRAGQFEEPPFLAGRVEYVGPVIRKLRFGVADRARVRGELGIASGAGVVSVMPGGFATEQRTPIAALVHDCLTLLGDGWQLFWLAGSDQPMLADFFRGWANVRVLPYEAVPERFMVASDVILTKANRVTVFEAAALGVPTVSLSSRTNPLDDRLIESIGCNQTLALAETAAEQLAGVIRQAAERGNQVSSLPLDGASKAAASIARYLL